MSTPVLSFFSNRGGVSQSSLVYHLSWMLSEMGHRVLACDFDPQAHLTEAFLDEEQLAELWLEGPADTPRTICRAIQPLTTIGNLREPVLKEITPDLAFIPGDLALSGLEEELSGEWSRSLGGGNLGRQFRGLTAFWRIVQLGARQHSADIVLADVGPSLGAINRSALIASDFVIVSLAADLIAIQALRSLGPALERWRNDWKERLESWRTPEFELPAGRLEMLGYVVEQSPIQLGRPVLAHDRWVNKIPAEYRAHVLKQPLEVADLRTVNDPECLATLKHFRSLHSLGQEARKPIFHLTVADGAIGSHARAVQEARADYGALAKRILERMQSRETR